MNIEDYLNEDLIVIDQDKSTELSSFLSTLRLLLDTSILDKEDCHE